ncbi:MAG TPA: S8 family serine peptidase [Solirubrobacteraceae bacterium]|jgi:hypothetical protein
MAVLATLISACLSVACASAAGAESVSAPLPEADYTVSSACGVPQPAHAGCLALELRPASAAARAWTHPIGMTRSTPIVAAKATEGAYGLRPEDLEHAYFPGASEHPDVPVAEPQTIALVDAYNDYKAAADLKTYSSEFGLPELPACGSTLHTACFEQVNQKGESALAHLPFPHSELELATRETLCLGNTGGRKESAACVAIAEAEGWAVEISTDIEMAHAVCQNCKIVLVEAESSAYENLIQAEATAVSVVHATEVSNSWGGGEPETSDTGARRELEGDAAAFRHPGTVITASAGDEGYFNWAEAEGAEEAASHGEASGYSDSANFPASLPYVVAVGGTRLILSNHARASEVVWNERSDPAGESSGASGGGCSRLFTAQPWQQDVPDWSQVGCGSKRAVADIAADADPYTGVAVYDSVPDRREERGKIVNTPPQWLPVGGTSVASPIIASMFALAGGAHGVEFPAQTLYSHLQTASLYDVTSGGNGICDDDYGPCQGSLDPSSSLYPFDCGAGELICNAAPGCGTEIYAGPTGVGSPNEIAALEPSTQPAIVPPECPVQEGAAGNGLKGSAGGGVEGETPQVPPQERTPKRNPNPTPGSSGTSTPGQTSSAQPKLLALKLAKGALAAAVEKHGAHAHTLRFTLRMSAACKVQVTLARYLTGHGHKRWRKVAGGAASFTAAVGASKHSLEARGRLPAGSYRLMVALHGGSSHAIFFTLR